jgi:lysophospholipase L1-like esterase
MRRFPPKTTLTIAAFLVFLELLNAIPLLRNFKVVDWQTVPAVLEFTPRKTSSAPIVEEQQRLRPDTDPASYGTWPVQDPSHNLDRFYAALERTERHQAGAVTRILHYGDSPTTADQITADMRLLMQTQFGDAGHGFCLVAKPWGWYEHRGVDLHGSGWKSEPANQTALRDGLFGLGGVTFFGDPQAKSRIGMQCPAHTRVEVAYLRRPGGGVFSVISEKQTLAQVETAAGRVEPGWVTVKLPEGAEEIEIRPVRGVVRMFGASFENPGPGVVYDSLGVNGAYVAVLARMFSAEHWTAQLQHYRPQLVVINYGTNESVYPTFVDQGFKHELRTIVSRVRQAVPESSILIMSPMDRGHRAPNGEIGTVPVMPRLVAMEESVALETGCAFFNTFQAMGGPGTMGKWYTAEPRLVGADFIHPLPAGARIVGNLLYRGLTNGYNRYKLHRMQEKFAKMGSKK